MYHIVIFDFDIFQIVVQTIFLSSNYTVHQLKFPAVSIRVLSSPVIFPGYRRKIPGNIYRAAFRVFSGATFRCAKVPLRVRLSMHAKHNVWRNAHVLQEKYIYESFQCQIYQNALFQTLGKDQDISNLANDHIVCFYRK